MSDDVSIETAGDTVQAPSTGTIPSSDVTPDQMLIPVSDAYRFFEGVASNFDSLVTNLQVFGSGLVVLGLILAIGLAVTFGRDGQRTRTDLQRQFGKFEEDQKEALEKMQLNFLSERQESEKRLERFENRLSDRVGRLEAEQKNHISDTNKSLAETTHSIQEAIQREIDRVIFDKANKTHDSFNSLYKKAADLEHNIKEIFERYSELDSAVREADINESDPYFNYTFVSSMPQSSNKDTSQENRQRRAEAVRRLEATIAKAIAGAVDSNLLFNSGMAASRLEFEDQALKLLTLAHKNSPTTSHALAKYRLQMTLGRAYRIDDSGAWITDERAPKDIAADAFSNALKAASAAPLPQNEIIYAELWNMSQKVREDGGYERMLDTLMASYQARYGEGIAENMFSDARDRKNFDQNAWERQKTWAIPSNLPAKISSIHALIGTTGWHESYVKYRDIALEIASKESAMTTWRRSAIRDMRETAERIGDLDDFDAKAEALGIDLSEFERENQARAEMLSRLQRLIDQTASA